MATDKENERYSLVPFYLHTHTNTHSFWPCHSLLELNNTKGHILYIARTMSCGIQKIELFSWSRLFHPIHFISFHFTLVCACACVCQDTNCYCCYFHTNHIPNTNTMLHNETLLADTKGISKHMIESMKSSCHILIGKKVANKVLHCTQQVIWIEERLIWMLFWWISAVHDIDVCPYRT